MPPLKDEDGNGSGDEASGGEQDKGHFLTEADPDGVVKKEVLETYDRLHGRQSWLRTSRSEGLLTKAPPVVEERTRWIEEDRMHHPYSWFDNVKNPPKPIAKKRGVPPALWCPVRARDPPKEKASPSKSLEETRHMRKSWNTEWHVPDSKANHEIQQNCRAYFDRPLKDENEGIPKVRQVYQMNDRVVSWNEDPVDKVTKLPVDRAAVKGFRRTYVDQSGPWNTGGIKDFQLPSYWRNTMGQKSAKEVSASKTVPQHLMPRSMSSGDVEHPDLCARLARFNAPEAVRYWRVWSEVSKHRLPSKEKKKKKKNHKTQKKHKKKTKKKDDSDSDTEKDTEKEDEKPQDGKPKPKTPGRRKWDERFGVILSKDNDNLSKGHRQYFSGNQFLSGYELGHPGNFLGLPAQRWRRISDASHSLDWASPTGPEGRLSNGRFSYLR
jgi:hypothetical protein